MPARTKKQAINHKMTSLFPLSDQIMHPNSTINSLKMQQLALAKPAIEQEEYANILKQHALFLQSGGAGGHWKTLVVKGIVIPIYECEEEAEEGIQASFERRKISNDISFKDSILPFSNFCAAIVKSIDFKNANLGYCLMTDMQAAAANFENAVLSYSDFSRSNLKNACFKNADLSHADFENCNLENADFRGAILTNARFPGTTLTGIKI